MCLLLSGQKLWPFWTHQVHSSGGPGHHVVRLRLGTGERPEHQVFQAEGGRGEGRVRQAHGEEEEGLKPEHRRHRPPQAYATALKTLNGPFGSHNCAPLRCISRNSILVFLWLNSCWNSAEDDTIDIWTHFCLCTEYFSEDCAAAPQTFIGYSWFKSDGILPFIPIDVFFKGPMTFCTVFYSV